MSSFIGRIATTLATTDLSAGPQEGYAAARVALLAAKEPDPHVVAAVADKLDMDATKVAAVWMLLIEETLK